MNCFEKAVLVILLAAPHAKALADAYLSYEPVGTFDEVGVCYSGAMDEENRILAVGCKSGIFFGPAERLSRISITCTQRAKVVSRIRFMGEGIFVASTPCGLFSFGVHLPPVRIALQGDPGAMARIDAKNLVVYVEGELMRVELEHGIANRIGRWPSSSRPVSLAWSRNGAISQGWRCQQGQAPWKRFLPPSQGARAAIWDEDHVLWIGPRGRLWKQALSSAPIPMGALSFLAGERMRGTKALGHKKVWVRTDYRWFLLSEDKTVEGWLPKEEGPFVPMRTISGSAPPVLLGRGVVFKAFKNASPPSGWCRFRLSPHKSMVQVDEAVDLAPSFWIEFIPKLTIKVGESNMHSVKTLYSGYDELDDEELHAFVGLQWPLGSLVAVADSQLESLRSALASRRYREQKLLEKFMARLQLICTRGESEDTRLELEELVYQLHVLGVAIEQKEQSIK